MSRVVVEQRVLRWAMERSGRHRVELERDFPKLGEWESGESRPTLHQLEKFARATRTPFGFLFLSEPPTQRLPIPSFRTQEEGAPQSASPDLVETLQIMERRQAWMREFLVNEGRARLSFVGSSNVNDPPPG